MAPYADPYKLAPAERSLSASLAAPTSSPELLVAVLVGLAVTTTMLVRVCLAAGEVDAETEGEADGETDGEADGETDGEADWKEDDTVEAGVIVDCSVNSCESEVASESKGVDIVVGDPEVKANAGNDTSTVSSAVFVFGDEAVGKTGINAETKGDEEMSCGENGPNGSADVDNG